MERVASNLFLTSPSGYTWPPAGKGPGTAKPVWVFMTSFYGKVGERECAKCSICWFQTFAESEYCLNIFVLMFPLLTYYHYIRMTDWLAIWWRAATPRGSVCASLWYRVDRSGLLSGALVKGFFFPVPSGFSVVRITFKLQMLFFLVSLLKSVLAFISDFCC